MKLPRKRRGPRHMRVHRHDNEAKRRGWRVDRDGWWTRPLRAGDPSINDPDGVIGFVSHDWLGRDAPGPFVRTGEQALAYDERTRI